jgi:citrate lyase subunit beta/citryl-CoA lyase
MTARSYLYVPGDRDDRLAKAVERGADALIADLEDAVAPSVKEQARMTVAEWVRSIPADHGRPEIWVRVNSGELMEDDIAAVLAPALTGICIPKAESAETIAIADKLLTGDVAITPLIETARAVFAAVEIARRPRVSHLAFGEADLTAELGITPSDDAFELTPIRMQIILASAAAGVGAPVGPVSTDFKDLEALRHSTEALKRMGFRGRAAIHPTQVDVINEVFTPTDEEVESARKVIAAYEEAQSHGAGAITGENGRMIDEAVARAARQVLALVEER